ncbi:MAG TPA: 3'-5' exonuclease [Gammaproteobacteria bacterium]|nr:3'-5' exonuclease [Acidiferrobacteraceae bacterium]HCX86955.1 3'-5' exonuclease [Gammaproteobacteria bacterium]|tara:strand:- start:22 stop:819 length:798 start_codon:yes stop_codon:yes gene_type:complete
MLTGTSLVFDIETVPDVESGRRLYDLENLNDDDVARAMRTLRIQKTGGTDFLPHSQHRIVAISAVLRSPEKLKVWSLGSVESTERELLERFFDGIERFRPVLISWNGSGFDLPVIHYRSLKHGVSAPLYWESGDGIRDFRYNNYLNRYHSRHLDLMDVLAGYQPRAFSSLDGIAVMLGLPGKMGMSGSKVWDFFQAGKIGEIRAYCETDVLNTYLIFLQFEKIRGALDDSGFEHEARRLAELLGSSTEAHLAEFLGQWRAAPSAR